MSNALEEIGQKKTNSPRENAMAQWAAMIERHRQGPAPTPGEPGEAPSAADGLSVSAPALPEAQTLRQRAQAYQVQAQDAGLQAQVGRLESQQLQSEASQDYGQATELDGQARVFDQEAGAAEAEQSWQDRQAEAQRAEAEQAQTQADRRELEASVWKSQAQTLLLSGGGADELDQGAFLLTLVDSARQEVSSARDQADQALDSRQGTLEAAQAVASRASEARERQQSLASTVAGLNASGEQKMSRSSQLQVKSDLLDMRARSSATSAAATGRQASQAAELGYLLAG